MGQKNDSILIKKVIHHPVVDGKHLMDYHVHNQLTAGIDGLTIRNLFFNDSTNRIEHYHFYWYRNGSLVRDEKYDNEDNLTGLVKYENSKEGQPLKKEIYLHVPDTLEPDSSFIYHYRDNRLAKKEISTKNSRRPIIKEYSYTGEGKIESISIKGKGSGKAFPKEIYYSYRVDDQDRLVIKEKTEIWKKKEVREKWEYQYKNNRLEKINYLVNNEPEGEKEFVYYPDGKKKIVITRDKDGNELSYIRYEYDAKIINLGVNKNYNRSLRDD
jgi:hypothetical protein